MHRLLAIFLFLAPLTAGAASPPKTFHAFSGNDVFLASPEFMRFHRDLMNRNEYAESWFFILEANDAEITTSGRINRLPTMIFIMFSLTNLGPGALDASVNVYFRPAGEDPIRLHRDYSAKDVQPDDTPATTSMGLRIGPHRIQGGPQKTTIRVCDETMNLEMTMNNIVPPFRMRDSSIRFDEKGQRLWALAVQAPRANAIASVRANGQEWEIRGIGYADHGWATVKIPDVARSSQILRVWHDDLTILIHDVQLSPRHGNHHARFAMLAQDDKLITATDDLACTITALHQSPEAPYPNPAAYQIDFDHNRSRVTGNIEVLDVFQSEDILANLSWPVRIAISTFYTKPWLFRMIGRYDLEVTIDGKTRRIQGEALLVTVYY